MHDIFCSILFYRIIAMEKDGSYVIQQNNIMFRTGTVNGAPCSTLFEISQRKPMRFVYRGYIGKVSDFYVCIS